MNMFGERNEVVAKLETELVTLKYRISNWKNALNVTSVDTLSIPTNVRIHWCQGQKRGVPK